MLVESVGTTVLVVGVVELEIDIIALVGVSVEVEEGAALARPDEVRMLLRVVELETVILTLIDVSVEVVDGAALATPDEPRLLLSVYSVSPLLPPHISAEFPPQGILHLPSVAVELPNVRLLPQKHSVPYSRPKYWYPVQFPIQYSIVMSVVPRNASWSVRIVVLSEWQSM